MTERGNQHTWRLFWAIPLPEHTHEHVAHLQEELNRRLPDRSVRWIAPDHIHTTLVFLGNWAREKVPELARAVSKALEGVPPFSLEVEAIGTFPNLRRPRVIWLGIGGDVDALHRVQTAVARAMVTAGWKPEKRPYFPHLTIGRVRKGLDDAVLGQIGDTVRRMKVDPFGKHVVREVILFRSDLRPTGAVYTPVARVVLQEQEG